MTDVASRELGLGFLGIGQAVARIFQQYPDMSSLPYRITAAADTRSHSLARFATEFAGSTYTDAEQLCADPSVDVVYIATPPELHRDHALMAAHYGKHMIVEKPLAMSVDECTQMVDAADAAGVKLMAGHTHSFDAPVRAMAELVHSRELGELQMVNTWNFNDFNRRPWPTSELRSTDGPVLNQGPHQVDVVRQIAGGLVRTVRASTIWDDVRECVGGYTCHLEFQSGVSATLVYDARAFFDVAELHSWVAEDGGHRSPLANQRVARNFAQLSQNSDQPNRRWRPRRSRAATAQRRQPKSHRNSGVTPPQARSCITPTSASLWSAANTVQSDNRRTVYSSTGRTDRRTYRSPTRCVVGRPSWLNYIGRSPRTVLCSTTADGVARHSRCVSPSCSQPANHAKSLSPSRLRCESEELSWVKS